jgi:hypothetical protein
MFRDGIVAVTIPLISNRTTSGPAATSSASSKSCNSWSRANRRRHLLHQTMLSVRNLRSRPRLQNRTNLHNRWAEQPPQPPHKSLRILLARRRHHRRRRQKERRKSPRQWWELRWRRACTRRGRFWTNEKSPQTLVAAGKRAEGRNTSTPTAAGRAGAGPARTLVITAIGAGVGGGLVWQLPRAEGRWTVSGTKLVASRISRRPGWTEERLFSATEVKYLLMFLHLVSRLNNYEASHGG